VSELVKERAMMLLGVQFVYRDGRMLKEDEEEEKMCKALATAPRVTEREWCSGGSSSAATDRQGARVHAAR
jgi:hypothetical protein